MPLVTSGPRELTSVIIMHGSMHRTLLHVLSVGFQQSIGVHAVSCFLGGFDGCSLSVLVGAFLRNEVLGWTTCYTFMII